MMGVDFPRPICVVFPLDWNMNPAGIPRSAIVGLNEWVGRKERFGSKRGRVIADATCIERVYFISEKYDTNDIGGQRNGKRDEVDFENGSIHNNLL
jgi:hypothetical protein